MKRIGSTNSHRVTTAVLASVFVLFSGTGCSGASDSAAEEEPKSANRAESNMSADASEPVSHGAEAVSPATRGVEEREPIDIGTRPLE
jgi:hypothetical protein